MHNPQKANPFREGLHFRTTIPRPPHHECRDRAILWRSRLSCREHHQLWDNGHEAQGRVPTLDGRDLQDVQNWIEDAVQRQDQFTLAQVVELLERLNNKTVTKNALQKVLTKAKIAKTIVAHPEEAGRMKLKHAEVARYINDATVLHDVPAEFVFNMDERGSMTRQTQRTRRCLFFLTRLKQARSIR